MDQVGLIIATAGRDNFKGVRSPFLGVTTKEGLYSQCGGIAGELRAEHEPIRPLQAARKSLHAITRANVLC